MQFPNPVPSAHHSTLFGVSCAHWSAIRTILHLTHRHTTHTTHTTLIVKDIACIFWLWMLNFSNWCSNFLMSSTVINRQAPQIYLIAIVRHFFLSIIYFLFFYSVLFQKKRKLLQSFYLHRERSSTNFDKMSKQLKWMQEARLDSSSSYFNVECHLWLIEFLISIQHFRIEHHCSPNITNESRLTGTVHIGNDEEQ